MKRFAFLFILISVILAVFLFSIAEWRSNIQAFVPTRPADKIDTATVAANKKCLECHASRHFEMAKPSRPNKFYAMKMPRDYIIDSSGFKHSSHWNFKCTDCHSSEYDSVPHDQSLRFETISTCNDCHGSDTAWSRYGFDTISTEFEQSVHKDARANCYSCHDPHTTQLCVSNDSMPLAQVIETSNAMCTKCHAIEDKSMIRAHLEFPHIEIHFTRSRCIDCHARPNSGLKVAHNVRPKEESVRDCNKCHSQNSEIIQNLHRTRSNPEEKESTMAGYFRSSPLTIAIIIIALFALAVGIGHIIWVLIRKKS